MTSCCEVTGDGLQSSHTATRFADSTAGWLIGQAIKALHAEDDEAEASYRRATELLGQDKAGTEWAARLLKEAYAGDPMLRWSVLHVLADAAPAGAGELLAYAASERMTERDRESRACESPRDMEILVRTMAIEGLTRIAPRQGVEQTQKQLLAVLERQEEPALRIEAVKALLQVAPGSAEMIRKILPEALHFAIDLKRADARELQAEPKFEKQITCEIAAAPAFGVAARAKAPSCSCQEYTP